ncbi:acetyl-CoA carboxylase biotin carboxylase subunit [Hyphomonas sp.]|uniref:acetyl-CoA carboxylase biotin carboxylase subunit n=1 Tax=Hyphomonas sp. TaxID=87 RepID=UPI003F6E4640
MKVLIANRGEIAARILKTLNMMGFGSVAVYHRIDAGTIAVRQAGQIFELTGDTPVAAYLDGQQIIEAAIKTGADAVHPGYGFLSENAAFASACRDAGLIFIGPRPETIALMGDKIRARTFVEKSGFPVAPSAIEDHDPGTFEERARAIGAPLLIKPSAGGGGKGMRIVRDLDALSVEIATARREGERYFGDGRLYVERYIENPRHIEVQILGDAHGKVLHLFERECSLQRRFQKVVEEAPSPALSATEREEICRVAAGIAQAASYEGAGTIEFIYGNGEFFFLEMNTRIQVEHPVTEAVTGIDLVEEQIRIAMGEPLRFDQTDVSLTGHSIELRIYAEDPEQNFMPTTGPLLVMRSPTGEGIRIDSGVIAGGAITAAFDPMIAKLIVHANTREQAIERALIALSEFVILGCRTNIGYLSDLLRDEDVASGNFHTGTIQEKSALTHGDTDKRRGDLTAVLACAAANIREVLDAADRVPILHATIGDWRN